MAAANASQQPQCAAPQQAAPLPKCLEMPGVPTPPPGPPPPKGTPPGLKQLAPPGLKQLAIGAFVKEQDPPKPPASGVTYEAADEVAPIAVLPEGNAVTHDNNQGPDAENEIQGGGKAVEFTRLGQSDK